MWPQDQHWEVVAVGGEVDLYTAPGLRESLLGHIQAGQHHVVVDLAGVTFIDSSGFAVLVGALKRLRAVGGDLRLCGAGETVRSALRASGLTNVFGIYPDLVAATGRQSAR